jgi:hypothetical protein
MGIGPSTLSLTISATSSGTVVGSNLGVGALAPVKNDEHAVVIKVKPTAMIINQFILEFVPLLCSRVTHIFTNGSLVGNSGSI